MRFSLFMYCTVGRRPELEAGMAGRNPLLYQRMLDEIADYVRFADDAGYFGPGSAAWAVHGSLPTMVAGIRALLMQALHPGAMAGVHDWSRYQEDPLGRLSGTVKWVLLVTFADRAGRPPFPYRVLHGARLDQLVGGARPYTDEDAEPSPPPPADLLGLG